jgi:uncharacterized membrane protein YesL
MNNLFHPESKIMQLGSKLFDLISLQLATLLFSLPLITAGAAFTAMHRVLLVIYRDQVTSVWKEFFSSFRSNFKQATILWIGVLALVAFFYVDVRLIAQSDFSQIGYLLLIPGVYFLLSLGWLFVLQSRYTNTIGQTVKNALMMVFLHPLYSIINVVLMLSPVIVLLLTWKSFALLFFMGYTLPGILRAIFYSQIFDALEGTDWRENTET